MDTLPPNRQRGLRDALHMIQMTGLEHVTKALLMGDGFDLQSLSPLANRCRALADAYDKRMEEFNDSQ
jgi:hypothetical protein